MTESEKADWLKRLEAEVERRKKLGEYNTDSATILMLVQAVHWLMKQHDIIYTSQ